MKNTIEKINGIIYEQGRDAATAAANIRKELKFLFPSIKFSVRKTYATHDSVITISYTDGVRDEEVEKVVNKYGVARFESYTDYKDIIYTNFNKNHGAADWVEVDRKLSPDFLALVEKSLNEAGINSDNLIDKCYFKDIVISLGTIPSREIQNFWPIGYNDKEEQFNVFVKRCAMCLNAPMVEKEATKEAVKIDLKDKSLAYVDYSEKAFAIVGDTKEVKDILKSLGGKFNPRLSCGAGWIFSKKVENKVKEVLSLK